MPWRDQLAHRLAHGGAVEADQADAAAGRAQAAEPGRDLLGLDALETMNHDLDITAGHSLLLDMTGEIGDEGVAAAGKDEIEMQLLGGGERRFLAGEFGRRRPAHVRGYDPERPDAG